MRRASFVIAGVLTLAACGSDTATSTPATEVPAAEPEVQDTAAPSVPGDPIVDNVSIEAGGLAEGTFTVAGQVVEYVTIAPDGFTPGDTAPVLLAFPPGGQGFDITRSLAEGTYSTEALARGWVVISPAAPVDGELWYQDSQRHVPALLDWIETWVAPEGGSVHVAGVSNGGLSTFAVASVAPDRVHSLLTFPGFPRGEAARDALPLLVDVPVRMFVGETDTGWVVPMQAAANTLDELGGDVTLDIVQDEGHVIGALSDGVRIFDELDAVRSR